MESNDSRRFISKEFKCPICLKKFKKLVNIKEIFTKCPQCGHDHCTEFSPEEASREYIDSTYRINFNTTNPEVARQYHPITDLYDISSSNIYGDSRRQNQPPLNSNHQPQHHQNPPQPTTNTDDLINLFIPFNISPFAGSVRRFPFNFSVFSSLFADNFFENPSHDFFMDNFASNFTSTFFNPMARIIFNNTMNDHNRHMGNPPASKKSVDKLKRFKMGKEFCKKDEKDETKLEYPTCSICLMDITNGQDTILVPCGHMFHDNCITKWLNLHNSCPVCRFELPTDDEQYEMERNQRNMQRNVNISRNRNIRTVDLSNSDNFDNINQMGESFVNY